MSRGDPHLFPSSPYMQSCKTLVLPILVWTMLFIAQTAVVQTASASSSNMDIDYSHSVVGTGTVMTDFKMGDEDSTLATGRVRGSGEVMNKYIFVSNNSENISIEDQFLFTKLPAVHEITVADYPQMTLSPTSYRLLGTSWASRINISMQNNSSQ